MCTRSRATCPSKFSPFPSQDTKEVDELPPSEHLFHLTVKAGRALPLPERLPLRLGNAHFLPVAAPAADHRQRLAGLGWGEEAGRDVPGPQDPGAGQQQCEICGRLSRLAKATLPEPAHHQPQLLRSEMIFFVCLCSATLGVHWCESTHCCIFRAE